MIRSPSPQLVPFKLHRFGQQRRDYPKAEAIKVYTSFWNQLRLSTIEVFDADLATYLFDYGVNSGPGRAATDFQRLLNVLNDRQKLYPDMKVDGAIGPRSLSALESYAKARGAGGKRGKTAGEGD